MSQQLLAAIDANCDDTQAMLGKPNVLEVDSIGDHIRFTIFRHGEEEDTINIFVDRVEFGAVLLDVCANTEH